MIKILNNADEFKPLFMPQASEIKEYRWAWLMLIVLALLFFFRVLSDNLVVKFDDAYMYIRYANHILAGYGHVWNAGDAQVYGSTSMFYSMIIVVLKAVTGLSDSHILIFASGTLGMLAIATLAKINSGLLGLGSYLKWLSIYLAIFVFTTPYLYHSNSGMDTTLSLLFNSLLIFAVLKFIRSDAVKDLFVVIVISFLTIAARPDNVLCAILFPILAILFFGRHPEKRIAVFLMSVLLLLLTDAVCKYLLLSDPLPLAFYAKRNGFYEGYIGQYQWNQMAYILMFLVSCIPFVFLAPHIRDELWYKVLLVFLFPVLLTAGYYATVQQIMGHFSRYYFPFIPYVAGFSALMLKRHVGNCAKEPKNILHRLLKIIIAYAVVLGLFQILPQWYTQRTNALAVTYTPNTQYAKLALTHLPQLQLWDVLFLLEEFSRQLPVHTKVAMSEYGYLGAKAMQIDVIDTIGLHDRQIAHNGFDQDVFFAKQPDIIWFPHKHYTKLNATIVDNAYFQANYEYYPDAFLYGFAINKTSKHYVVISQLFDELWKKAYGNLDRNMYLAHIQDDPAQ